jgi:anti-sigma B factor antagonist
MTIETEDLGDVTILRLAGLLNGGGGKDDLRTTVEDLVHSGRNKVIVDMAKVPWANSVGLGSLHFCYRAVKETGGSFKLTNVSPRIRHILHVSHFDTIFESYQDVRGALASFYR